MATTTSSISPPRQRPWNLLCEQLSRLVALYPEAGHNSGSIHVVAQEWAALLKHEEASTQEFLAAMSVIKRRCRFFPTVADLAEALREIREHPPVIPERLRLAEPPHPGLSPEKRRRIRQCGEIIAAQLNRKISPQEASKRLAALGLPR